MDLSYYSPGTIFCFHSEKKPPVANYSFSITDGGGGGAERVSLLSKLFSRNYLRITELKRKETITKAEREHNFCKKVMLNFISLFL